MEKKITLTESEFRQYIGKQVRHILAENIAICENYSDNVFHSGDYTFEEDETMEYVRIPPSVTGLDRCVYLDDGFSYKRRKHPLWVMVSNGNQNTQTNQNMLTISVESKPKILNSPGFVGISNDSLVKIFSFISKYRNDIIKIANEESESYLFIKKLRARKVMMAESKEMINEMPIIRPTAIASLPTNVYVGATDRTTQHGYRLKFQYDRKEKDSRKWPAIVLSPPFSVENLPRINNEDRLVDNKGIRQLRLFADKYCDLLIRLVVDKEYTTADFVEDVNKDQLLCPFRD